MKMKPVNVSEEYVETLCEKMLEWVKRDDSYTVPQFLQFKGIGYPYLKYILHSHPRAFNAFEVMKSILANRWLHMSLNKENLSQHQAKLIMRYLRIYDSHALDTEEESRKRVLETETKMQMQYISEKYDRSELTEPYKGIYDDNVNKRRGPEKA